MNWNPVQQSVAGEALASRGQAYQQERAVAEDMAVARQRALW
jgi:hypothetical protein